MRKSTFHIPKMDCPSEEGLIKMKLSDFGNIQSLRFDIPNRKLEVFYLGELNEINTALEGLNFGSTLISTEVEVSANLQLDNTNERKLLWQVLTINFFFFVLEFLFGFISNSIGLVADGLDMLADSIVYGLSLFAVGGTINHKNNIARASGYFQLGLAVLGFAEVIRRFAGYEEMPSFQSMIIISILALIGNASCLFLLQKNKSDDSHMKASMIFTSNDVIVNIGVIIAGVFVYITKSKIPDLIIGAIVFFLVLKGAFRILNIAKKK